jgi:hypothetical protein
MEFLREEENLQILLLMGYSKGLINKYRERKCLGCGHLREQCQCPFSGSAHPTPEERLNHVKQELDELRRENKERHWETCSTCDYLYIKDFVVGVCENAGSGKHQVEPSDSCIYWEERVRKEDAE